MTQPVPVYRHGLYLLTRRVVCQLFLLLPDRLAVQIFAYVLGLTLLSFKKETRIRLHAAVLMSNHLHAVIYDPEAQRTDFLNRCYSLLARAINTLRGRKGRLFDLPSYKDKAPIMDRDAALRSIVYTICNPVKAGLVDWPHEWPGSLGDWRQILTVPISVTKPPVFFDQAPASQGGQADEVLYYLSMPTCFERENMTPPQYEALIRDAVRAECGRLHAERDTPPLGVEAALALSPYTRPQTPDTEIDRDPQRFRCDPARVNEFLELWIEWIAIYYKVRDLWISGRREGVEFPPGTDAYHRLEDAPVGDLESDSPFAWNYPP